MRLLLALLLLPCAIRAPAAPNAAEAELVALVEHERAEAGLPAFLWSEELAEVARGHALDMAHGSAVAHVGGDGSSLVDRVVRAGLRCARVAENVGTAPDVARVHQALMDSPGHRANLLDPELLVIGFAVVEARDTVFVVQDFAVPAVKLSDREAASAVLDLVVPGWVPGIDAALSRTLAAHARHMAARDDATPAASDHGACWELAFVAASPTDIPENLRPTCDGRAAGVGVAWARTPSRPLGGFFVAIAVRK